MHTHNSASSGRAGSEENHAARSVDRAASERRAGSEEDHAARSHPEHVVLDIGGELGALIVHTGAAMLGTEVEISPAGEDELRSHKDVLQREISGRPAYTAVFDKVSAGLYTLWVNDEPRARDVAVTAGAVAELDWR
jgi:hypothetical protein